MHVAHDALAIDDEHAAARKAQRAERAVRRGYHLVGVGQKRKPEPVLEGELLVALHALGRDRDHLRVERFELRQIVVVAVELLRAHRRVVARVCLLYTSPSPRDRTRSRMPFSA